VRLGTCIALELAIFAGAAGGAYFAISRGAELASDYLASREAAAATAAAADPPPSAVVELPQARLVVSIKPAEIGNVFGAPDAELLAPLAAVPVKNLKANHGGTSLSLRIQFANGSRAAFKPEQTWPQSNPRKEIAAFRIDRLLGIGHVPPAKSGAFTVTELLEATDPANRAVMAKRLAEEGVAHNGILKGELSWWIPEIIDMKIAGHFVDDREGVALWIGYLQPGVKPPSEVAPLLPQLATLVLFDLLVDNSDRWSGWNTKASTDNTILYFMDNTLSFSQFSQGHAANLAPFYRIGVFPRGVVQKIRGLTREAVAAAVGDDPNFGSLLTPGEINALMSRREHMLHHIDKMIARFGEDAVLALP
jgi:hypothetical protein